MHALYLGALLIACLVPSSALLAIPSTWGSSMVVEAEVANTLYGTDEPSATITVTAFSSSHNATADSAGIWQVTLPAQPISTVPTSIVISSTSGGSLTLTDVLVGYTVVCSG